MPDGSADAIVRAGFMLIPEKGDSTVMNSATSAPATQGVKRAVRRELETFKTIVTRRNEMASSAPKATHGPAVPGTVVTYETGGNVNADPNTARAVSTPARPPRTCAHI